MNVRKVIVSGLVAGITIIILNILAQFVLGDRFQREMNAWIPGSADRISMSGSAIIAGIIMKLIIGIILVWLYAAVVPRFGSGLLTTFYVVIAVWLLGAIFFSDFAFLGMISVTSYIILEVMQLLSFLIAALIGVRIYSGRQAAN